MQLEDYTTGTVSVSNGSSSVTGSGTAWQTAGLKAGDTFYKAGYALLIASVDSDTSITLKDAWPGADLSGATYVIRYQPDNSRMQGTTRQLLDQFRNGIWVNPDAAGTTAEKADYDDRAKGFRFLDVSVNPFTMYVKLSDTSGDWSEGTSWVGPKGDKGDTGAAGADGDITWEHAWVTATAYTANQAVSEGGSSYVCLEDHTSDTFATDLAAGKWELMAQKGGKGDTGDPGAPGADGSGVPAGGDEGQVLAKASATDQDVGWIDPPAGGVVSIVEGLNVSVDDTDPAHPVVSALTREFLTADRAYYVATTGSDTNDGLTSGTAFLTTQKPVDIICGMLDLGGFTVTINVGAGSFTGPVFAKEFLGGDINIVGAGSGSTTFTSTGSSAILVSSAQAGVITVSGAKLTGTGASTSGIRLDAACKFQLGSDMEFGACTARHILAAAPGCFFYDTSVGYTISGGATAHFEAQFNAFMRVDAGTTVLTGTPAFSSAYAVAVNGGSILANAKTFSGSATGKRYAVSAGGGINTAGGGASYFPGNTAGTATTPGWYL